MKGSQYDREVLTNQNLDIDLSKATLKDTDFMKIEEKIWIKPNLAESYQYCYYI